MQNILVIDITGEPARALLLAVEDSQVSILAKSECPVARFLEPPPLNNLSEVKPDSEQGSTSPNPVKELISSFGVEHTTSVILIPTAEYLSLNLKTPFGDPKLLKKVLISEVQDVVPFDLDDLLLHYEPFPGLQGSNFDIHVGIIPESKIRHLIEFCDNAGVEATVLCPPSSALSLLKDISPEVSLQNAAIFYAQHPNYVLGVIVDSVLRFDRVLHDPAHENLAEQEISPTTMCREIISGLAFAEQYYERKISNFYLIGTSSNPLLLSKSLGRDVIRIDLSLCPEASDTREQIACLSSFFGKDVGAPKPLANFRCGNFVLRYRWGEVFEGFKNLWPFLAAFVACVVITLSLMYESRAHYLSSLDDTMSTSIRKLMPSMDTRTDASVEYVQQQIGEVQAQLKGLGSPFQLSPVDTLFQISRDFQKRGTMTVRRISIVGNKVTLEGRAPNYSSVDIIEKAFDKKKRTYCGVKKKDVSTINSPSGGGVSFSFSLELCES